MNVRNFKDSVAHKLAWGLSACAVILTFLIAYGLFRKADSILAVKSFKDLLFSPLWRPFSGNFGLAIFIASTIWVTVIAMVIAVPLGILTAIYLCEYAPKVVRKLMEPVVDLLGGISPVIFGVWGVIAIVPLVRDFIMPFCSNYLPFFPFRSSNNTGFSVLAGGIVLATMILPIIISVASEVIKSVPFELREVSLALGATKWQTVKWTVLKKAKAGIIAAVILGLSRAFGETIAVLMVCGCSFHMFPKSIFDAGYPMPALIANTYGEMMSVPLYDSAIFLVALILFIVTAVFNIFGWGVLVRIQRNAM